MEANEKATAGKTTEIDGEQWKALEKILHTQATAPEDIVDIRVNGERPKN